MLMKSCLTIFIGFMISVGFYTSVFADSEVKEFDVAKQCSQEGNYKCQGPCKDGWGSQCYYDSTNSKIEANQSVDSQSEKCYGYYFRSECTPCRNSYKIESKETSCEVFYQSINEMNKTCSGCLRQSMNAGG